MSPENDDNIPTLTEVVSFGAGRTPSEVLARVRADVIAAVLALSEELLQTASREMEAILFERVLDSLRERLPRMIDEALKEKLGPP